MNPPLNGRHRHWLGGTLLGLGLSACAHDPPSKDGRVPVVVADAELCAEHGVLQGVCAKCNPRLAAVFQAKGDWCVEHGLAESFCPICRPAAGGRPAVALTPSDGAPADGTRVRFKTRMAADQAGLVVVAAKGAEWTDGTEVIVRLNWDATRTAAITTTAPGLVVQVLAEVGDPVEAGQTLAVLKSPAAAAIRARRQAADRALEVAVIELKRQRLLFQEGVTSEAVMLDADADLASAQAERDALSAQLSLVGGGSHDSARVRSPMAGVVSARHVRVGQTVELHSAPLFELVDPTHLWAEVDIPETQLSNVTAGQRVQIVLDALPDDVFDGTLATLAPGIDVHTRTARGRIPLANPDLRLRAHFTGTATILGDTATQALVVPEAAVQRAGDVHLVFVREAVDSYLARRVRVLARQGDRVRISGGVAAGDMVVTTGSFLLKTETLKDSIGAGCCDVE